MVDGLKRPPLRVLNKLQRTTKRQGTDLELAARQAMADGGSGQEEHCTPSCESNDDASDGTTPLHWACIDGDLNTVQLHQRGTL